MICEIYCFNNIHKGNFAMRGLNLDHLTTFASVIELGGFSAAGQRLNLTQPAVSLQIRQLERKLGVRLVERVGRRATATAAGLDLLEHARRIEAAVSGAIDAMAYHATGTVGRVRIGTGGTACIYLLPPILRELRRRFPTLEIVVSTGNTPDVLKAIEANSIDVGLVTLPAPGRIFQVTPVIGDEFVALFPAGDTPPTSRAPIRGASSTSGATPAARRSSRSPSSAASRRSRSWSPPASAAACCPAWRCPRRRSPAS
jgi:DNA-binding transcriptional LysR family regulator